MHEVSLAQGNLDVVRRHAEAPGSQGSIRRIKLRIGAYTQVDVQALLTAFQAVATQTPAAQAGLLVERGPVRLHCRECGGECEIQGRSLMCAHCSSLAVDMLSGREMQVEYLEVD